MEIKLSNPLDDFISGFDRALRTLSGAHASTRPNPAENVPDPELDDQAREHAAGLMRVNHCGEICAQALYEGQALTARSRQARTTLLQAAAEERDHLSWCRERLTELHAKPSLLDPLFYATSFAMGAITGLAGDKVSLGFVEATEDQVVKHLENHLQELPAQDMKSRAIIDEMRHDEAEHGANALSMGGQEFPQPVKQGMAFLSRVMTTTTYRI